MQETTQAKNQRRLRKETPYQKNKANTVYCEFYYDFGWFFMDFEEN